MVKVKAQGTLVLPFQRISDLLKTVESDRNKFHIARDMVMDGLKRVEGNSSVDTIDFEVSGNRVLVTCETIGPDLKDTFKQSFDVVYSVVSQLLCLSLKEVDIENEDTLMAVRDITIISVED